MFFRKYRCRICLFSITILFLLSDSLLSQDLFRAIDKSYPLSNYQAQILSRLQNEETTIDLRVVEVNKSLLKKDHLINLNLFPGKSFIGSATKFVRRSETDFTWHGNIPGRASSVTISVYNDAVIGSIVIDTEFYRLRSLGQGLNVVIKVDPTKYPSCTTGLDFGNLPDGTSSLQSQNFFSNSKVLSVLNSQSQSNAGDKIARVLVAYTPAAKDSVGGTNSIIALIKNSIEEANDSFDNSDVPIYLELAHKVEVQYTEVAERDTVLRECPEEVPILLDLLRLQNPSDGYMDNIHGLRDTYAADIVVLIFDPVESGLGGEAFDIGSGSNGAFCVVNYATADGPSWSFAHEIGHLYGGRHEFGQQVNADSCTAPFGNAHGHILGAAEYRTMMAVNQGIRIQYWSDPQKTFQGMPLGETNVSEAAIVLTQRARIVANFRTQPVSDATTALSANSQRKVVTNQDGTEYHMVFESNGEIHYVKSVNEGATWTSETLVSAGDGSNAYPSLAINETNDSLYVVWQRDLGNDSYDILFNKRGLQAGERPKL